MSRVGIVVGCVLALVAVGGCAQQVSYEPAPLTEVPPGGDRGQTSASPARPRASTGAAQPKAGELPIDCATLALELPDDWNATHAEGVWTYDLGSGSVGVSGEFTDSTKKIKQSELVALARGPFEKAVTQVRGDGTVAGKGRSDTSVEWRLAKATSSSTQVVVIAYHHPGEPADEAIVTTLDKAVGRATLRDIGTC